MPDGLVVEVRRDLPRALITVAGELDLASAGLLTAMLDHVRATRRRTKAGARPAVVDVDLSAVTFADSSGLAPVLQSGIRVVAVSEPVRRLLHLLRDLPDPSRLRARQERAAG